MTLLYRAIWQDDRSSLLSDVHQTFAAWVQDKGIDLVVPEEGVCANDDSSIELVTRRAEAGCTKATQYELLEDRPRFGERWTTRLTVIDGDQVDSRWLWVDLERVADADSVRPPLAAPKIVRMLLENGADPRVDQVRLTATAQRIPPKGLAGLIRNRERTLPLVVFSEDPAGIDVTSQRADEAAKRLAAAVQVVVLTSDRVDEFKQRIGEQLGVWGGAARVYLPNAGPSGLRPERHRYIRLDQMTGDPHRVIRILSAMLSAVITARRPPAVYEQVRRELMLGRSGDARELLELAEAEIPFVSTSLETGRE